MATKDWRTLRVVVELPVRGELANEKRLAHAVASVLSQAGNKALLGIDGPVGKFRVIQFNRMRKPQAKGGSKLTHREEVIDETLAALLRLATSLEQRIVKLERATDPHRNSPAGDFD